jgi:hypothetical protein
MIANSSHLRNRLLKEALGLDAESLDDQKMCVKIEERVPEYGVMFDVCILLAEKPRLIVEGKCGKRRPGIEQCNKYVRYLKGNRTRGRQRLLYVLDWYDDKEAKEIVGEITKRLKKEYRHYVHRGTTWENIGEWCTEALHKEKDLGKSEAMLLRQYAE